TLARQLITREGNLHLTAITPVITTLPDPDAAWTAIITLLAELTTAGTLPPPTSITQFRYNDDGTPSPTTLPPPADAPTTPHPRRVRQTRLSPGGAHPPAGGSPGGVGGRRRGRRAAGGAGGGGGGVGGGGGGRWCGGGSGGGSCPPGPGRGHGPPPHRSRGG